MLKRLKLLAIKLISVKGIIFILATVFMFMGKIDSVYWGLASLAFVSFRTFEKAIDKIPGGTIWKS